MIIEKISKLFAIAVPPLILSSCVRLITYYNHWNIPIIDYLTPAEILLSFIDAGLAIMLLTGVYFIYTLLLTGLGFFIYFLIKQIREANSEIKNSDNVKAPKPFFKYLKHLGKVIFYTVAMIGIVLVTIKGIWFDYEIIPTFIFHLFLFFILTFVVHHLVTPKENASKLENKFFGVFSTKGALVSFPTIYISISITLIVASYFYARYQTNETRTHPTSLKITLKDDLTIETNNNLIYLGKTSNYYFLQNISEIKATIIPAGEVKEVNILKRKSIN